MVLELLELCQGRSRVASPLGLEYSFSWGTAFSRSWKSSPLYSSTVVWLLNTSHLCENFTTCSAHRSLVTVLPLPILCLARGISHYEYKDWSGAGDANGPLCGFLGLFSCVAAFSLMLCTADLRCLSLLELWSASPPFCMTPPGEMHSLYFPSVHWNLLNASTKTLGNTGLALLISALSGITVLGCVVYSETAAYSGRPGPFPDSILSWLKNSALIQLDI